MQQQAALTKIGRHLMNGSANGEYVKSRRVLQVFARPLSRQRMSFLDPHLVPLHLGESGAVSRAVHLRVQLGVALLSPLLEWLSREPENAGSAWPPCGDSHHSLFISTEFSLKHCLVTWSKWLMLGWCPAWRQRWHATVGA